MKIRRMNLRQKNRIIITSKERGEERRDEVKPRTTEVEQNDRSNHENESLEL